MAISDQDKINMVRDIVNERFDSFETWAECKTFLANITPQMIRQAVINRLATLLVDDDQTITRIEALKVDRQALADELAAA